MRATLNLTHAQLPRASRAGRLRPRLGIVAGAAAAVVALGVLFGAEEPGAGIRADLGAGADALRDLPQTASDTAVRQAMREAFPGRSISVDARDYPALVAVTLHDVGRQSCAAAAKTARRLEGSVVVELEGYAAPDACGAANAMTWRFMP